MTKKAFEVVRDCTAKISDRKPSEEKLSEIFTFLSEIDLMSEIIENERSAGICYAIDSLPEDKPYKKIFKSCLQQWSGGMDAAYISDHAADMYMKADPEGYDSLLYFAAVWSIAGILKGEWSFSIIDSALQYLLPDGWRWYEEDYKDEEAHKGDKDWYPFMHSHRKAFLGDSKEKRCHRYDDIKVGSLISEKEGIAVNKGIRVAEKLEGFNDGALQIVIKNIKLTDLEKALYMLPEDTEEKIMQNLDEDTSTIIKGDCLFYKDTADSDDILASLESLEAAIDAYDGDPNLESGYEII